MKYATPFVDLFRPLTAAEAKSLTESIKVQGVIAPVVVYQSAKHGPAIIDGVNRYGIASELKIDFPIDDRGELDDDVAEELADELNAARRHLTAEDIKAHAAKRRKVVAELRAEGESIRTIAEKVGAKPAAVQRDIDAISKGKTTVSADTVDVKKTKGKDGKTRTAKPKKPPKAKPAAPKDSDPLRGGNNFDFGANAKTPEPEAVEVVEADPLTDPDAFVAEMETVCRQIDVYLKQIRYLEKSKYAKSVMLSTAIDQIEAARKQLWVNRPAYPCEYCHGEEADCRACRGTGRLAKDSYKRACEALGKEAAA